nr:hypothetical protein CFP56_33187 [Quercus suber]
MPSDDEWITENERQFPLQKESFLDVLDKPARREAYNSDENELEEEATTRNAREEVDDGSASNDIDVGASNGIDEDVDDHNESIEQNEECGMDD